VGAAQQTAAAGGACMLTSLLLLLLQVMWALPSHKRSYLPRLGGPLCGITTSTADPARCGCSDSKLLMS
jgi:hypothetical protein